MIIFDEKTYAEKLLENGFGKFMSRRDLEILAKYYCWQGIGYSRIEKNLQEFCLKHNPEFNIIKNIGKINGAINVAKRENLKLPIPIIVTENEINKIKTIEDYRYQKILFVMIVIAKFSAHYYNKKFYLPNNYYVNITFREITRIAKVNFNRREKGKIIQKLVALGFIIIPNKGHFKLLYGDNESATFIEVNDVENIISYFPYFCEKCGKTIDNKSKRHNLCDKCYAENRKEKININAKKYYKNKNK